VPLFAFPPAIRKVIYTTNAVESLHRSLRKIIKTRGSFPTDEAALKCCFWQSAMLVLNGANRLNGPRQWGSLQFCLAIVLSPRRAEGSTKETGSSYTKIRTLPARGILTSPAHWRA